MVIDRSVRWLLALRPMPGMIWLALLVLPWFVAIMLRAGDGFLRRVGRPGPAEQAVQRPGGARRAAGLLFPAVLGDVLAGRDARRHGGAGVWAARREPGAKFLLAWIVPAWILFELVVTKLPHYVLPLYPAIAILIAGVVDARVLPSRSAGWSSGTIWWFILPVLLGLVGLVLPDLHRPAIRIAGLAVDRRVDGDGLPRLAALSAAMAPSIRCCAHAWPRC